MPPTRPKCPDCGVFLSPTLVTSGASYCRPCTARRFRDYQPMRLRPNSATPPARFNRPPHRIPLR